MGKLLVFLIAVFAGIIALHYSTPDKKVTPTPTPKVQAEQEILTIDEYLLRYEYIARLNSEQFGVPASILLDQGLIKSEVGNNTAATEAFNHFGVECHSKKCREGHCIKVGKNRYVKYMDPWQSYGRYARKISTGRYSRLKEYDSYKRWAVGLGSITQDSDHWAKVLGLIDTLKLYRYDLPKYYTPGLFGGLKESKDFVDFQMDELQD